MSASYWTQCHFRLDDESIGKMQFLMIDAGMAVAKAAKKFGVSLATAYRIRKAVPEQLVSVNWRSHKDGRARIYFGGKQARQRAS